MRHTKQTNRGAHKSLRVLLIQFLFGGIGPVFANPGMDCTPLDPRQEVSEDTKGKVKGAVDTLYKIVRTKGEISGEVHRQVKNLGDEVQQTERSIAQLRMIYLVCEFIRTSPDLDGNKKASILKDLSSEKETIAPPSAAPGTQPPALTKTERVPLAGSSASWIADPRTGCAVFNPHPRPEESITWSGPCDKDGRAEGQGVLEWRIDGHWYDRWEGTFKGGKRNGRVISNHPDGFRSEAEYREEVISGHYMRRLASGNRLEGEMRNGEFIGNVHQTLEDGGRYVGEMKNWKWNGPGTMYYPSGDRYVGEWKDGQRSGQGTPYYASGN